MGGGKLEFAIRESRSETGRIFASADSDPATGNFSVSPSLKIRGIRILSSPPERFLWSRYRLCPPQVRGGAKRKGPPSREDGGPFSSSVPAREKARFSSGPPNGSRGTQGPALPDALRGLLAGRNLLALVHGGVMPAREVPWKEVLSGGGDGWQPGNPGWSGTDPTERIMGVIGGPTGRIIAVDTIDACHRAGIGVAEPSQSGEPTVSCCRLLGCPLLNQGFGIHNVPFGPWIRIGSHFRCGDHTARLGGFG